MTLSARFESIIPLVRQAQSLAICSRAVSDPTKLVRHISCLRFSRSNELRPAFGTGGITVSTNEMTAPSLLSPDMHNVFLQQLRNICGRENCADPCDFPPCSPENLEKTDCMKKKKGEKDKNKEKTIYEVYWNRPECCNNECLSAFPRFDDLYYRESDKENRIYTRTWAECPEMVIAPRPICCTDKINLPPLCKRNPKERPKTACGTDDLLCPPELEGKCPKIRMPCCRAARMIPCRKVKTPSNCKKFSAPSPSFSECRKPEFRRQRITECWCLAAPSMCQVWAEWRRLQSVKRVNQ